MRFPKFHASGAALLALTMAGFAVGVSPPAAAIDRVAAAPTIEVPLGVHQFGKFTAPDAVVAEVGADGVGWAEPGPGMRFSAGAQRGPSSFAVAADGTVWLLDWMNSRLLGWPQGKPNRPALTVPLSFVPDAFALGPNGTFYATEYTTGSTMVLHSVAADGRELWQAPTAVVNVSGNPLQRTTDGVLYAVEGDAWRPLSTASGAPLPVDQQHPLPINHQPLPGGGQLVLTSQSARELTVTMVDATSQPVRTWRITSRTDMGPQGNVRPALVGNDPVVTLYVHDPPARPMEFLALRLTASGAQPRLHLKNAIWGDWPTAGFQTGPGQSYYQLQTSRTTGVKIVRHALTSGAPAPTTTGGGVVVPAPTPSQAQPTPTVAPTPTAEQPAAESTSGSWWPWVGVITLAVLAAVGGGLLIWRRRRHRPPTAPPWDRVPDDPLDLTQPSSADAPTTHADSTVK